MEKAHFDKWIKTNAELSVLKEEAEKLLQETAEYDLTKSMDNCFHSVRSVVEDMTPLSEYHVRRAISRLAHDAAIGKLTLVQLLEGHNSVDSEYSPAKIVMRGCQNAIEKESEALNVLWKQVNT